jgi:segregation and condensation protein B
MADAANLPDDHEIPFEEDPDFAALDQLYRQALDAMETVESDLNAMSNFIHQPDDETLQNEQDLSENETSASEDFERSSVEVLSAEHGFSDASRVTPRQIIEAALFVGGTTLTTRKLCSLLRDDFDPDFVDGVIDNLNRQYATENRPYEIQFGKGGFRIALRAEFEPVRNRVYGYGPREIKLSQEALEILSLVAYKQPITPSEIEQLDKPNAKGMLRQLLRRELITIERTESATQDVSYRTSPRFLQVFGLSDLEELPQAEDLGFK